MSDNEPTVPSDTEIEAMLAGNQDVTVVLAVPNGIVEDGHAELVPTLYRTTLSAVMAAQATLADGVLVDTADVMARATDRIAGIIKDRDVAEQVAAHLLEGGLLVTVT